MEVEINAVRKNRRIVKFIDLPKLFDLLITGRIFFPTLGTLSSIDPFECAITPSRKLTRVGRADLEQKAISLSQWLPDEFKTGIREYDFDRYQKWLKASSVKDLQDHINEMERRQTRSRVVCCCWHLNDGESDAMWKIYGSQLGAMVTSTVGRLESALCGRYSEFVVAPNPQEYQVAPVKYVSERPVGLPAFYRRAPWFLKRRAFKHEQELRVSHFASWTVPILKGGLFIDVNPQMLIEEIVLSPFNPSWVQESLAGGLNEILRAKGLKISLARSKHMRPPSLRSKVMNGLEIEKFRRSMTSSREVIDFITSRKSHV